MVGPSRGQAWPGECARVPQFKMTLPICPTGSSILEAHLEVFHAWTSPASYLLLPHSHCCRCLLQTGTFVTRKGATVRASGLAHPQASCPLSKALPHTLPCAFMCQITHRADGLYLPLGSHSHGSLSLCWA